MPPKIREGTLAADDALDTPFRLAGSLCLHTAPWWCRIPCVHFFFLCSAWPLLTYTGRLSAPCQAPFLEVAVLEERCRTGVEQREGNCGSA